MNVNLKLELSYTFYGFSKLIGPLLTKSHFYNILCRSPEKKNDNVVLSWKN